MKAEVRLDFRDRDRETKLVEASQHTPIGQLTDDLYRVGLRFYTQSPEIVYKTQAFLKEKFPHYSIVTMRNPYAALRGEKTNEYFADISVQPKDRAARKVIHETKAVKVISGGDGNNDVQMALLGDLVVCAGPDLSNEVGMAQQGWEALPPRLVYASEATGPDAWVEAIQKLTPRLTRLAKTPEERNFAERVVFEAKNIFQN